MIYNHAASQPLLLTPVVHTIKQNVHVVAYIGLSALLTHLSSTGCSTLANLVKNTDLQITPHR